MKVFIPPNLEPLAKRINERVDKKQLANDGKVVNMSGRESSNKLVVDDFEVEGRVIL
jgi:hypothetical protein